MSKELDSIRADEVTTMTSVLERAFIRAGCQPACHCCRVKLPIGTDFRLAYIKPTYWKSSDKSIPQFEGGDEMLCMKCTPRKLQMKRRRITDDKEARNCGYSRPHSTTGDRG